MQLLPSIQKRRIAPATTSVFGKPATTTTRPSKVGGSMAPATNIQLGSVPQVGSMKRPLAAKQGTTNPALAPIHAFPCEGSNEIDVRLDATVNFVTSLGANQPIATIFDRVRAYETMTDDRTQVAEVEGRAFPVAAYFTSHLYQLYGYGDIVPGSDSALANNVQKLGYYKLIACLPAQDYLVENVIKTNQYTGTGALTSYAEDDGADGRLAVNLPDIAPYYLARTLTVNQVGISKARAFMLAAAVDFNSGFTIRAGGKSYVAEEINSIEDQLMEEFGIAANSITGAASAAPAGHGVRGQPQDPFTGAGLFLFADVFDDDTDISIVVSGSATLIGAAVLSSQGLDAIRSA